MEPNKLDDIARKAVLEKENEATISKEESNILWGQLNITDKPTHSWIWKAAVITLLLSNSLMAYYFLEAKKEKDDLQKTMVLSELERKNPLSQITDIKEVKPLSIQEKDAPRIDPTTEKITEIQYILKDRIVYQDRIVEVVPTTKIDSLLSIIQNKDDQILALSESQSNQNIEKNYPANFIVAFGNETEVKSKRGDKNAGFKFQLSLLNRN